MKITNKITEQKDTVRNICVVKIRPPHVNDIITLPPNINDVTGCVTLTKMIIKN